MRVPCSRHFACNSKCNPWKLNLWCPFYRCKNWDINYLTQYHVGLYGSEKDGPRTPFSLFGATLTVTGEFINLLYGQEDGVQVIYHHATKVLNSIKEKSHFTSPHSDKCPSGGTREYGANYHLIRAGNSVKLAPRVFLNRTFNIGLPGACAEEMNIKNMKGKPFSKVIPQPCINYNTPHVLVSFFCMHLHLE